MHLYGLVLFIAFPILALAISFVVFKRRNDPFLKCRNPALLIAQNCGTILSFCMFSFYIAKRPNFECQVTSIAYIFNFCFMAMILLIRGWEYCISYHISQMRAQFRSFFFQVEQVRVTWVYTHRRWIQSKKVLYGTGLFLVISSFIPVPVQLVLGVKYLSFILCVRSFLDFNRYPMDPISETCVFNSFFEISSAATAVIMLSVSLAYLIRKSRDAFYIKREIKVTASICLVSIIITYMWTFVTPKTFTRVFPGVIFLMAGQLTVFIMGNVPPLIYGYSYKRIAEDGTCADFTKKLESISFRNCFYDFLMKQFCQENLQFYEVVCEWKLINKADARKKIFATRILDNFIKEDGLCQVNIWAETRQQVERDITSGEFPDTVFDAAVDALINDMYTNSFKMFKTTSAYKNLTLEIV